MPYGVEGAIYDLREVDLLAARPVADVAWTDPDAEVIRGLARDAIVYGLPAALQYANLYRNVLRPGAPRRFNEWHHDRRLATPDYADFRTPNVDTLYSTAWLDLSRGPVELEVPAMNDRYYTVNLLDVHSNAVNLSTRTLGPRGGRVWLVAPGWTGAVPTGVQRLRVASEHLWALMRIFVRSAGDVADVCSLQDRVVLRPERAGACDPQAAGADTHWPAVPPDDDGFDAAGILCALDAVLRHNGHPVQEEALLARFRALGIGAREPLDPEKWSTSVNEAVALGHADARRLIAAAVTARGAPAGNSGWRTLSSGAYGYNYLHRAATNYVGLGGTTREESGPYTALVDGQGEPLDGNAGPYRLRFTPPPVDAFWSVTAYDRESRGLVANPIERYAVNTLTEGVRPTPDGSLTLHLGQAPGPEGSVWLPVPEAPFYLVLRAYLGHQQVVDGTWVPSPVERAS
ncbi:DUF1254 domain-containing protein [Nocardioides dubius]|uniref:DUF1254 domain-containing protein n=1 Tax=Nocardioides dubius TaxID=317019 RepID=A0ABN1TUQ4_9ACTN